MVKRSLNFLISALLVVLSSTEAISAARCADDCREEHIHSPSSQNKHRTATVHETETFQTEAKFWTSSGKQTRDNLTKFLKLENLNLKARYKILLVYLSLKAEIIQATENQKQYIKTEILINPVLDEFLTLKLDKIFEEKFGEHLR